MEEGAWRTISGRRIFIKDGQSLTEAMKNSGKFNNNVKDRLKKQVNGKNDNNMTEKEINEKIDELEKNIENKKFLEARKDREELRKLKDKLDSREEKSYLEKVALQMEKEKFEQKIISNIKTEEQLKTEARNKVSDKIQLKAQENSDNTYKAFTSDERDAIDYYTMDGYYDVNEYLKGNYSDFSNGEEIKTKIDSAINKYKMDDDYTLYRGVDKKAVSKLKIGDEYSENGYLSTSLDKKIGIKYTEDKGDDGVLIKINTSKEKTKGLYIGVNSASYFDESEFLISREQKMILNKITKENDIIVYEMEVK